jgi:kynureninase
MEPIFKPGLDFARQMDANDPLVAFRKEFVITDPDLIYLDGNSLGRMPVSTIARMETALREEWGNGVVRSWSTNWWEAPARIGEQIAKIIGAAPGQVMVGDSTSTNLFKLSQAALALQAGRKKIITDEMNFPTDLYILQGVVRLMGNQHNIQVLPSHDGVVADTQAILDAIDEDTALLYFSTPTFKSGFLYDVDTITRRAHEKGALVLWDVSHGVGAVALEFDRWQVDFGVGCTYKYLNGGPGSPAFLYVRRELQDKAVSPMQGWWGHQVPFAFDLDFIPAAGIQHFMAGCPAILSLLAVEPSLDIILRSGIIPIRQKSIQLTSYTIYLFDEILESLGFTLGSPRDAKQRGSHVSIRHPLGYQVNRALIEEMKVIPDFREPDNIRLGVPPLYTSFEDIWTGVQRIKEVIEKGRHLKYPAERLAVT